MFGTHAWVGPHLCPLKKTISIPLQPVVQPFLLQPLPAQLLAVAWKVMPIDCALDK